MNGQSIRNISIDDDAATQPFAATEDFAPTPTPSHQLALPLKLAASDGSLPHLTGEVRDLMLLRLREVALLVSVGWSFVLLLCTSGPDGLFNVAHLGVGCVAAMAFITLVFLACWVALRAGPRYSLGWLRAFEAVYPGGGRNLRRLAPLRLPQLCP